MLRFVQFCVVLVIVGLLVGIAPPPDTGTMQYATAGATQFAVLTLLVGSSRINRFPRA